MPRADLVSESWRRGAGSSRRVSSSNLARRSARVKPTPRSPESTRSQPSTRLSSLEAATVTRMTPEPSSMDSPRKGVVESGKSVTGAVVRGHEFHYASLTDPGRDAPLVALTDAQGRDLGAAGGRRGQVSGAFFHAIAADAGTDAA